MRNTASAIVIGDKFYNTNLMIQQLSGEISTLGTQLEKLEQFSQAENPKKQERIINMIKIRCELLGKFAEDFD